MYHPIIMQALAKTRQKDLLKEAEDFRIARLAKTRQPTHSALVEHFVNRVDTALIQLRRQLTKRTTSSHSGTLIEDC